MDHLIRRLLYKFLTSAGQKVKLAVGNGNNSVTWTFDRTEIDTNFGVLALPTWSTTTYLSARSATAVTISFGTAAGANATVDILTFRE
jgi:hypothetical protein